MSPERQTLEQIDAALHAWARRRMADEDVYPVLIGAETLRRAEYDRAFPHLLMSAAVDPQPGGDGAASLQHSGHFLSPAVCYHAYASMEGRSLPEGTKITARGHCFRNEEPSQLRQGRRQIEFEMRELILIGAPDWIESELVPVREEITGLATPLGLDGAWEAASDPFFLPSAGGKVAMQRLLGTKMEYCLPSAGGLAIASINRHGTFFGERFRITTPGGASAHTACVAFGLDRWAACSMSRPRTAALPGATFN